MFEGDFFEKIRKMVEEMERKSEEVSIEVKGPQTPQVRVRRGRALRTLEEQAEVKETLETEHLCLEKPREVIFCMSVPGVGREGIEIRTRGKALEIVAKRADGKAYFSTFELPRNAVPQERILRVRDGFLVLIIPKRKRS